MYSVTYKKWTEEMRIIHRRKKKNYKISHPDKTKSDKKKWNLKYETSHPEKRKEWRRNYIKRKRQDPKFRLDHNISTAIAEALNGTKNRKSWEQLVGYTLNDLVKHLEEQFQPGMSWENYGKFGWCIDHKIPISLWVFTNPQDQEFKQCWSLANLQPLWNKENNKKGNRLKCPPQLVEGGLSEWEEFTKF